MFALIFVLEQRSVLREKPPPTDHDHHGKPPRGKAEGPEAGGAQGASTSSQQHQLELLATSYVASLIEHRGYEPA